jgi:chorismate mutase
VRDQFAGDETVRRIRDDILEQDRIVLEAINARLRLVAELKEHKTASGYAFEDPAREEALIARLGELNQGPLAPGSLEELYRLVIAIGKRDIYRLRP